MGRLNRMPNEILDSIVGHCEFEDCKSLRATSKAFIPATTAKIFHTVYLALLPKFLDQFVSLSKNPEIAKCVKSFVFVGDILPKLTIVEYEISIEARNLLSTTFAEAVMRHQQGMQELNGQDVRELAREEHEELRRRALDYPQLLEYYENYNVLRQQQIDWEKGNHMSDQFHRAFLRLPNLISIRNANHKDRNDTFPWKRLRKDILIGPDDWTSALNNLQDRERLATKGRIHMSHLDDLFVAVTKRSQITRMKPLKSLDVAALGDELFFDDLESFDQSCHSFEHLTHLGIEATRMYWSRPQARAPVRIFDNIRWLVSQAASSLEELYIKCIEDDLVVQELLLDFDTLMVIRIPTLPRLRVLRLNCSMGTATLLDFLATHSQTLRCLHLEYCHLNASDSWTFTIANIPNVTRLDQVYLTSLSDDECRERKENYFEDGLDSTDNPHPHHCAVRGFILNGGKMPALDYDVWFQDEHNKELDLIWRIRHFDLAPIESQRMPETIS